jgi:hypothetical protein
LLPKLKGKVAAGRVAGEGPRCEKKERWLPVLKRRGSLRE